MTEQRSAGSGGVVIAVSVSPGHTMTKPNAAAIRLLEGLGVEGDAHSGTTVKHRSHVRRDPTKPNLRQVHLIHSECPGSWPSCEPAARCAPATGSASSFRPSRTSR
jgi:hypothetical protein